MVEFPTLDGTERSLGTPIPPLTSGVQQPLQNPGQLQRGKNNVLFSSQEAKCSAHGVKFGVAVGPAWKA